LYYRSQAEDDFQGNYLNPLRIRLFDISVNWSKYSKPWDVIYGHSDAGIAEFVVREVRRDLPTELPPANPRQRHQPKRRTYLPWHDPIDDNYSHTEIAVLRDGRRVTDHNQITTEAKKEFRQILSDRSRVIRAPRAA
jgi:hypothetical protein